MSKRYNTGTKKEVLMLMAAYAIRDQQTLIDCYKSSTGSMDEEGKAVVAECELVIADFKKILQQLKQKD